MKLLEEMIDRVNAGGISGEWATQSQVAASSVVDKLELPAIPDDAVVDLVGCLIDEVERLQKDRSRSENELDRLREWVAAVEDGYDKQKAEIERLRGLSIRARHSFRSGLTAGGGCHDGLTDADIEELVRLSDQPPA